MSRPPISQNAMVRMVVGAAIGGFVWLCVVRTLEGLKGDRIDFFHL